MHFLSGHSRQLQVHDGKDFSNPGSKDFCEHIYEIIPYVDFYLFQFFSLWGWSCQAKPDCQGVKEEEEKETTVWQFQVRVIAKSVVILCYFRLNSRIDEEDQVNCGSVLISDRFVISAAHCEIQNM